MIFVSTDKGRKEKLRQAEREELEAYCKEQGFTAEQTKIFVDNSMKHLYQDDDEALDE